jgi:hypothetical protein
MADAAQADADKERAPDTTPASDKDAGDAGPAAAGSMPEGGVGDMALQKKAEVGSADDPMEKEAEAVAQRIMRATEAPKTIDAQGAMAAAAAVGPAGAGAVAGAPEAGRTDPVRAPAASPVGAMPGESGTVQRQTDDASSAAGGELPGTVQSYLDNSKDMGSPLPEATRKLFESQFEGADFGDVRVHDDPGANEAARVIGAVAFTRNNHVFFAAGMYDPTGESGRAILAHELTHVVQQGRAGKAPPAAPAGSEGAAGGEQGVTPDTPAVVRRKGGQKDAAAGEKKPAATTKTGSIDLDKKELHIKQLEMPAYKAKASGDEVTVNKVKRPDDQIKVWEGAVETDVKAAVKDRIDALTKGKKLQENKGPIYYLRYGEKNNRFLIGDIDTIAKAVRRPYWDKDAKPALFDVDHKKEWQLSGEHAIDNMWLLFFSDNRSAGSTINHNINRGIQDVIDEAKPKLDKKPPAATTIRDKWTVTAKPKGKGGQAPRHWKYEDMKTPTLTKPLELVPEKKVAELKGKANAVAIYSRGMGGAMMVVDPDNLNWKAPKSFSVTKVDAKEGGGGSVTMRFYADNERVEPGVYTPDIVKIPGVEFGGYVDVGYLGKNMLFKGLSPLSLEDAEFDPHKGLVGKARITTPSLSLLKNTEIGVRLDGADVSAYALITADGIQLPGPLQITGGAIDLSVGTKGFQADGEMNFEINKVGSGKLKAAAGTSKALALSAELQVDSELFTKAEVRVHYKDGKWSGGGTLGVGEGKVKGIKSAEVSVDITEEAVNAKGSFESSLKGLEKGTLEVNYTKEKGLEATGQLTLGKLPGIEGGTIDAKIKQVGEGYSLSGAVTAKPSIPGVTGSVTGKYEDGAFMAEADLGYQKGMLTGKVKLGVTNQDASGGRPVGPPTAKITVWGGGQVTIKIAPWLQGTIGLELDPKGRMTVKGKVALPDALNLFDEKKVEKNIFKIGLDIPIIGVAAMGQRIGIFATIQGGLDASAGFGPGQLRGLSLEVTYSPDDEGATQVHGQAEAFVPAHAGLKLFVRGGLGVGIPVVSATAGLEVSGALGLEGAAKAAVNVDWSPAKGLVLDARGEIFVEPKFRFAIEAYVDVSLDLWLKTIELYNKKWSLASFEYGSGLRFGVIFPVHYEEGKEFQLSLDQVEFVYPSIDPGALLKGLVGQVI